MINFLPKESLQDVLSFIGSCHFLPIALSSDLLHTEYGQLFGTATTLQKVFTSIPLAQLALQELRKIYQGRQLWNKSAWSCAAYHGNIAVLEWLTQTSTVVGCARELDEKVLAKLARRGHLDCLQWARANSCPWDEQVCPNAAYVGHLELLQWAQASGCPWDERVCSSAARGGHYELLQWARANGCPWDENVCSSAVEGRHLKLLQWARANGCPWDESVCHRAGYGGHLELL